MKRKEALHIFWMPTRRRLISSEAWSILSTLPHLTFASVPSSIITLFLQIRKLKVYEDRSLMPQLQAGMRLGLLVPTVVFFPVSAKYFSHVPYKYHTWTTSLSSFGERLLLLFLKLDHEQVSRLAWQEENDYLWVGSVVQWESSVPSTRRRKKFNLS